MKTLAFNKRAKFDYDITDTFDAGLVLEGREVKSAKTGNVSLTGSYVKISTQGATLVNAHIGPYKYAPTEDYDPTKDRQILLNKKELNQLLGKEKGVVIVPLEIFVGPKSLVKLKIGVGRGRKKADKREYIKTRDAKRETSKHTDR
ncbi:MAG TPA: SsrA-binding protein SmpB [Candidatus Doudnabacteria bacterium]|nr:SsrA-binding protein SmpB [Candidatus Doudnabacteria bacterium]